MKKYEHVDVIKALEAVMKSHTVHYQSDFEIDKEVLQAAAKSTSPEDKRLVWMSRPSGTYCFPEQNIFLKDTRGFNTWRFYEEQTRDPIKAFAVKLTGIEDGKLMGNLYELDYREHSLHVKDAAIPAEFCEVTFKDGSAVKVPFEDYAHGRVDFDFAQVFKVTDLPKDPEALSMIMQKEARLHERLPKGDLNKFLGSLEKKSVLEHLHQKQAEVKAHNAPKQAVKAKAMEI